MRLNPLRSIPAGSFMFVFWGILLAGSLMFPIFGIISSTYRKRSSPVAERSIPK